jgi:hypothetical protein
VNPVRKLVQGQLTKISSFSLEIEFSVHIVWGLVPDRSNGVIL